MGIASSLGGILGTVIILDVGLWGVDKMDDSLNKSTINDLP